MGHRVTTPAEASAVMKNLETLQFTLEVSPEKLPLESLPREIQSVTIHGTTQQGPGTWHVGVAVCSKGRIRHPQFPQEGEPHLLTKEVVHRWLLNSANSTKKFCFVQKESMKHVNVSQVAL